MSYEPPMVATAYERVVAERDAAYAERDDARERVEKAEAHSDARSAERDAACVEAEELRVVVRDGLRTHGDQCGDPDTCEFVQYGRAVLSRPPTFAAVRAREALAALAWAEAARENGLADFTSREHEMHARAEAARVTYLTARAEREKAEKEGRGE